MTTRPGLLLARAWVLHFQGRVPTMAPVLEQAEPAINALPTAGAALEEDSAPDDAALDDTSVPADDSVYLQGALDTLWGEVLLRRGDVQAALARAQRGSEHLAEEQLVRARPGRPAWRASRCTAGDGAGRR